ncbi:MAG: four helix bundle protein, partial [Thermoplasmata archaeon]|nr:four helix bundle protein [Thermoplasmata archaeon]
KEARKLTNMIYDITKNSKFKDDKNLCNQIQKASTSIMSNIAEGFEHQSDREFIKFLYIAKASAGEVRSQLYISLDQRYIKKDEFKELYDQVKIISKLISKFIIYLKSCQKKKNK